MYKISPRASLGRNDRRDGLVEMTDFWGALSELHEAVDEQGNGDRYCEIDDFGIEEALFAFCEQRD